MILTLQVTRASHRLAYAGKARRRFLSWNVHSPPPGAAVKRPSMLKRAAAKGAFLGKLKDRFGFPFGPRVQAGSIYGIISPAFSTTTMSPMPDVFVLQEFGIMERRPFDGRAAELDRFEIGDRRQRLAVAHLQRDADEPRIPCSCRELKRHHHIRGGPSIRFAPSRRRCQKSFTFTTRPSVSRTATRARLSAKLLAYSDDGIDRVLHRGVMRVDREAPILSKDRAPACASSPSTPSARPEARA